MKKVVLLLTLMIPLMASADAVEIDGIYYNCIPKGNIAEVISGDIKYTGDVTIPATVTYNDVTLDVTAIGEKAFSGCSDLTSVTIPNSVTSIGSYAFNGCSSLISVAIPNRVTKIEERIFYACSNLKSVTIPDGVTSIGSDAFFGCSSLTSVTIPGSVTSIGFAAFSGCEGLTSVHITDLAAWCKIQYVNTKYVLGEVISNEGCFPLYYAKHLFMDGKEVTDLVVPDGVTSIELGAFCYCKGLTSVIIPGSVMSIGEKAFYGCEGLTSFTIGNSVASIGNYAFYGCSGLTYVAIPNSVTSIGNRAFANCQKLSDVYCFAENIPKTSSYAFNDTYINYATLHVPDVSIESYETTAPWSGFGTIKISAGDTPDIPGLPKCATPTIAFVDGKLVFSCETEGVKYVSKITPPSEININNEIISMPTTYKVIVYATKSGYNNSDVAAREINVIGTIGIRGDVNGDKEVGMPDVMFLIQYIQNGKYPDEEGSQIRFNSPDEYKSNIELGSRAAQRNIK